MFNYKNLSKTYKVRKLDKDDISLILELEKGNPQYFLYCPPKPSKDSILKDMEMLPPNTT